MADGGVVILCCINRHVAYKSYGRGGSSSYWPCAYHTGAGIRYDIPLAPRALRRVSFETQADAKGRWQPRGGKDARGDRRNSPFRHHKPPQTALRPQNFYMLLFSARNGHFGLLKTRESCPKMPVVTPRSMPI